MAERDCSVIPVDGDQALSGVSNCFGKHTQGIVNENDCDTLSEMRTESREAKGDMNPLPMPPGGKMTTSLNSSDALSVPVETGRELAALQFFQSNTEQLRPELNDSAVPESVGNLNKGMPKKRQFSVKSESCSLCGKMFYRVGDRKRHEASCLRSPYRCHYCIKCFSSEDRWYEHEKRHTEGPIYKCTVCGKTTINQRTWRQHMRKKHPEELRVLEETASVAECKHCGKTFNSHRGLGEHMKKTHSEVLAKALSHQCQYCQRSFSSSFGLLTHQIAVHPQENAKSKPKEVKQRKQSQCDVCGKVMTNMKYHSRIHSGERPYPCQVCKKQFASQPNLNQHMRTHTGEKPYTCRYCATSFTTSSSRIRHERIHTGDKPFDCQFCKKAFKSRAQLSVHLRSHTGETPYQCPECGKKFCYKNSLGIHRNTHKK